MKECTCLCGEKIQYEECLEFILDSETTEKIYSGDLFNIKCSQCGEVVKAEYPTDILLTEQSSKWRFLPEDARTSFLLGKTPLSRDYQRLVIGYKELAEKVRLREFLLDDQVVEIAKLTFLQKQKLNLNLTFREIKEDKLFFYVEGMKLNEVGITSLPLSVYSQILEDKEKYLSQESYSFFLEPPYINVSQVDVED